MSKLFSIGEALIDFIPEETGKEIKNISGFQPKCGGAPANVCGAFSKLGGESEMITKLGDDPFGDKLVDAFEKFSIGHQYVKRTDEANTALAFVSLKADGNMGSIKRARESREKTVKQQTLSQDRAD